MLKASAEFFVNEREVQYEKTSVMYDSNYFGYGISNA